MLAPLTGHGFACGAPNADQSAYLQWMCTKATANQATWNVVIDGNETLVKQVQGEGMAAPGGTLVPSEVDAFFRLLAVLPRTPASDQVLDWVTAHTVSGGNQHIGPLYVQIEPGSRTTRISLFTT